MSTYINEKFADVLIDSYSEQYFSGAEVALYATASYTRAGQTFIANKGGYLSKCKFYLRKVGAPPDYIYANLYDITGTYGTNSKPTGEPLAVSDPVLASTLGTSYALIDFVFSGVNKYLLEKDKKYAIEVYYGYSTSANRVIMGCDTSTKKHSGNGFFGKSTWTGFATYDNPFYVYSDKILWDQDEVTLSSEYSEESKPATSDYINESK
jgi:hypothetical protein